jgi:glycosyltransferase involved in cell wall biosynthesis
MSRGIDTRLFSPERRQRSDDAFVIGYVGRLSSEKNVRMLPALEERLLQAGLTHYRFLVVGEGSERAWLRATLRNAELPGILRGEELARAYASMDAFVFPSSTDTFGNVVLEAMASGVPPIVTDRGGPKFLFKHGGAGFVAKNEDEFTSAIMTLYRDGDRRLTMCRAARSTAERRSWDAVFEQVHQAYDLCVPNGASVGAVNLPVGSRDRRTSDMLAGVSR